MKSVSARHARLLVAVPHRRQAYRARVRALPALARAHHDARELFRRRRRRGTARKRILALVSAPRGEPLLVVERLNRNQLRRVALIRLPRVAEHAVHARGTHGARRAAVRARRRRDDE
jgi:hypothetical protein